MVSGEVLSWELEAWGVLLYPAANYDDETNRDLYTSRKTPSKFSLGHIIDKLASLSALRLESDAISSVVGSRRAARASLAD